MLVLGIETSGVDGSVALTRDGELLGERRLNQAGRKHAQGLIFEIGEVLREQGLAPRDLQLVAVSRGPGSFTGLRVGMVCAKTIAYATGCRFIAVDTFAAIASGTPDHASPLHVIEDAQRDDLFLGEYSRDAHSQWHQTSAIRIVSIPSFLDLCQSPITVTGPGLKKLDRDDRILESLPVTRIPLDQPPARVIAEIGRLEIERAELSGETADTDFWSASPFYLRLSAAEEKRAAQAGAAPPISP
ncbi:tRNA (adenosine(37)-N6)-threonylcarbamoyltransferase complex dimerization subunit type 1 TsaB [Schlesneria sp. T3-172]|uniref:tRNA (adenosine(37)-N6)-threonylcarbamoyltransferase complex dimerization subunit type 1 TsaB n=1 Tax=Schlesneria sphaerica TaxID=3373610 RepID=UPI0037C82F5B